MSNELMELASLAKMLSAAQRDLLLRYEPTIEEQDITEDECFGSIELFIELEPEEWDGGFRIYPGRQAWFASMGAHSPEGMSGFTRCWIAYTELGLRIRSHIQGKE